MNEIIKYNEPKIEIRKIETAIQNAKTVKEIKQNIYSKISALLEFLDKSGLLTLEQKNKLMALKNKAELKLAQLLSELERGQTEKDENGKFTATDIVSDTVSEYTQTLKEYNINEREARRLQEIKNLTEKDIDELEQKANEEGIKLLKKDMYEKAKKTKEKSDKINEIKNKINAENKIITDKYDVVILDPPWEYGRKYDADASRVASPYPEQNKEQINDTCRNFFKDDCVLWLWTTHAFIWQAKELIDLWGFDYKAILVWDKQKIGMGSWLRMQCEFCLLAIKGKPIFENTTEIDIIRESRREHSRKPDAFYELVKKVSHGKIFEYYSRENREGIITVGVENGKLGK